MSVFSYFSRGPSSNQWRRRVRRYGIVIVLSVVAVCALTIKPTFSVRGLNVWKKMGLHNVLNNRNFTPVTHSTPLQEASKEIYYQRLTKAMDSCFGSKFGHVRRIVHDKQNRLANCIVPKVGCTYWINIILFLNKDTGGHRYSSPADIPKWVTHFRNRTNETTIRFNQPAPSFVSDALRFMFVREPYSRLWSAWIDKFWLPGFWSISIARHIVTAFNLTGKCANQNISFEEFLSYVTQLKFLKHPQNLNEHWMPYKQLCDPCIFHPHVIGKFETFTQDSRYILASTNLTWVLGYQSPEKAVDHSSIREMQLITEYNIELFDRNERVKEKECASIEEVYLRIWTSFQYNGHLPAAQPFPSDSLRKTNYSMQSFLRIAEEIYNSWEVRSDAVQSQQKRDAMIAAYKTIPKAVMKKLQSLYKKDFKMYGYEQEPGDIFRHIKFQH